MQSLKHNADASVSNARRWFSGLLMGVALCSVAGAAQAWSFSWGRWDEKIVGSGEPIVEARDLKDFDAISLAGRYKVLVHQGSRYKLSVKAEANLLPYIETRVVEGQKGRSLEVQTKKGFTLSAPQMPVIEVEVPQLRAVSMAGSGLIQVGAMNSPEFKVSIAGSGDIVLEDIRSERLQLSISGSGDVRAAGAVSSFSVSLAGSGDVHARELQAADAKVSIAGSGDVVLSASKTLKVSIAGAGDVQYVGSPELSFSSSGSGSVKRLAN